jgi:HK97 family phage portal protein
MAFTLLDLSEAKTKLASAGERSLSLSSPDQFADIFTGLKTAAGKLVTRETAMRCGAVLACVRILMEDIATLPLILKKKTPQGATDAVDHPAYRVLKISPNPFQTSVEVREHLVMDCLLSGKGVAWAQRNGKGDLINLWPLHSERLHFQGQLNNGDIQWNYASIELNRTFTQNDLWRTNIMSRYIVDGRALILLAREAIGLAMAAEEQGARLFSNGIQTNLALKVAGDLDDNQRTNLLNSLNRTNTGSSNSFNPLLLENGLDAVPIGLTAQESQYIESRNYQLSDVARIFRIPEVMLGISGGKSSTFAAASEFFQAYLKNVIQPWSVRFEQTIERDILLPSEVGKFFVKHNFSALLRADQKTRFDTYAVGINAGFMSRQEARIGEDWDEVEGLDRFLIPLNTQILNDDGTGPEIPTPAEPEPDGDEPITNPDNTDDDEDTAARIKARKKGTKAERFGARYAGKLVTMDFSDVEKRVASFFAANNEQKLAGRTADFVLKGENKEFLKQGSIKNRAWQASRVMDLTGCTYEAALAYCEWRNDAQNDPLNGKTITEARERLIKLCLEANCV